MSPSSAMALRRRLQQLPPGRARQKGLKAVREARRFAAFADEATAVECLAMAASYLVRSLAHRETTKESPNQ